MTQTSLFPDHKPSDFKGHLARPDAPKDYAPPTHFPDLSRAKTIVLDYETHDPDLLNKGCGVRRDGYVVGTGIRTDDWEGDYYPQMHVNGPNCDPEKVNQWLRDSLNNFKGKLVGANVILYDGDYAQYSGIEPQHAKWRDVQWAEALIDNTTEEFSLNSLGKKYLGEEKGTSELQRLYGEDVMSHFREVHPAHARQYSLIDLRLPLQILEKQEVVLRKEGLTSLYDLESRLAPLLLYMRRQGVAVDVPKAQELADRFGVQVQAKINQLSQMVGFEVQLAGGALAKAYDRLGIEYPRTEKGAPSFTNLWLNNQPHPFSKLLIEGRELEKLKETFLQGYILDSHINGRLHTQFHPLRRVSEEGTRGTRSGRFSSSDPNLQNIPTRTELGKLIRELFIPEPSMLWWFRDYSQIEYRLLVHFAALAECAGADVAVKAYHDNPDIDFHQMVADLVGWPGKDGRRKAKNLNFGLVYGMGLDKLAATLGLSLEEAEPVMATYHERAPFIKKLYNLASKQAGTQGFIKTLLKRRSRFNLWEPNTREGWQAVPQSLAIAQANWGENIRRSQTHKALNYLLQGSAADMIKKAMVDVWEAGLIHKNGPLTLSLTVHDELGGSVDPGANGQKYLSELGHIMDVAVPLLVPVLSSGSTGASWGAAK